MSAETWNTLQNGCSNVTACMTGSRGKQNHSQITSQMKQPDFNFFTSSLRSRGTVSVALSGTILWLRAHMGCVCPNNKILRNKKVVKFVIGEREVIVFFQKSSSCMKTAVKQAHATGAGSAVLFRRVFHNSSTKSDKIRDKSLFA